LRRFAEIWNVSRTFRGQGVASAKVVELFATALVIARTANRGRTMLCVWPADFEPCHDLTPAQWIKPRLIPWGAAMGTPVTSIVPAGYDAYVRVFHPALAPGPTDFASWQEVADWSGGTFHPLAQFLRISTPVKPNPGPPPFVEPPLTGTVIPDICEPLVRELTRLTGTPSNCYFGIWEGRGQLAGNTTYLVSSTGDDRVLVAPDAELAEFQRQVAQLPRFEHPYRSYLLGRGSIRVACDLDSQPLWFRPLAHSWINGTVVVARGPRLGGRIRD